MNGTRQRRHHRGGRQNDIEAARKQGAIGAHARREIRRQRRGGERPASPDSGAGQPNAAVAGKAELRLTESDDPLEAGLEIHASPPGKKLQVMSLLSGGEQALTALSLLFAVFMTNPAPICVLDEVDAPLDDLNVERFCALVKDIAGRTDTRFMVITHHRVTMARMDRLYGVTMAEQGVSQLVSVNLQEADRMVA